MSVPEHRSRGQLAVRLVAGGSTAEGRGHIARALALSEALRASGLPVTLTYRFGRPTPREAARADELGVDLALAAPSGVDVPGVVVVDLPDPNDAPPPTSTSHLVVFDDRQVFRGVASVVVQPSRHAWQGPGIAHRVLAGFDYIPIATEYRCLAEATGPAPEPGEPPRILVCFGGSDPAGVTARIARALSDAPWRTEVVIGPSYRGATDDLGSQPLRDPPDLASRLARADVAVLGAGTMKFEAACLGRPTILLAAADDQLPTGEEYGATGAARFLGDGRTIDPVLVRAAVTELLADADARATMSARARALVDGQGSERIAAAIRSIIDAEPGSQAPSGIGRDGG